jgi:hypothetical protein
MTCSVIQSIINVKQTYEEVKKHCRKTDGKSEHTILGAIVYEEGIPVWYILVQHYLQR